MNEPRIEVNKEGKTIEEEKRQLWTIFGLSALIDILTTSGTIASLGFGVVIEEVIENLVSQAIAKFGGIKLTATDNAIGAIPLPGVTAVTVHCAKRLFQIYITGKAKAQQA
ncbi:MAG: hypothetical protein KTR13_01015 [Saprospiraceae bacterium]|nr:hypothetical protein [Saprospiraceae bacterium]